MSIALLAAGLRDSKFPAVEGDLTFGALGLWVAARHWMWRLPDGASRWRIEHLPGMLAAYTVACAFILAQFVPLFPLAAHFLLPVVGAVAILVFERRFGVVRAQRADWRS